MDRVVFALLRETELIRSKYEVKGKLSNAMDAVNRALNNAKRSLARLQHSYGSIINKESVEFGTYRYLGLAVVLRSADGRTQLYSLRLRSTQQPKNSWTPLAMFGGQYSGTLIRTKNIQK